MDGLNLKVMGHFAKQNQSMDAITEDIFFIPESWEEKSDQKSASLINDQSLIQFDLFE